MGDFDLAPVDLMRAQTALELMKANGLTERFGLTLGPAAIRRIVDRRFDALRDTGRVEFSGGIVGALIEAFCDSPYIGREDYEETVCELIDSFYYFRDASDGLIPDEDLIACMGSLTGSIGAAVVLTALPELLRSFGDNRMLVYSVVLVLVMIFRPTGLAGKYEFSLNRLLFGRRQKAGAPGATKGGA